MSSSTLFCQSCGFILPVPGVEDQLNCRHCDYTIPTSEFETTEITSKTHPEAFRKKDYIKSLKDKNKNKNKKGAIEGIEHLLGEGQTRDITQRATIEEKCAGCGYHQMRFYTMQLRSADEGQTVFYECEKCGHNYSVNN
eukprot:Nk52_evm1s926 gene=Nk52_evmTU1s926